MSIKEGTDGNVTLSLGYGTVLATASIYLWEFVSTRDKIEITPFNTDSGSAPHQGRRTKKFRRDQEESMIAFSAYIDQAVDPGWFNEPRDASDDENVISFTLYTDVNDNTKRWSGSGHAINLRVRSGVDVATSISGIIIATGTVTKHWE